MCAKHFQLFLMYVKHSQLLSMCVKHSQLFLMYIKHSQLLPMCVKHFLLFLMSNLLSNFYRQIFSATYPKISLNTPSYLPRQLVNKIVDHMSISVTWQFSPEQTSTCDVSRSHRKLNVRRCLNLACRADIQSSSKSSNQSTSVATC